MSGPGAPDNQPEVRLSDGTIAYLEDRIEAAVARGITSGMNRVMTDETAEVFWNKGLEVLQRQATQKTGRFVLDSISTVARKGVLIVILVSALYVLGGWNLVKAVGSEIAKAVAHG